MEAFLLGAPFVFARIWARAEPAGIPPLFTFLAIPILVALGWVVAIFLRRDEIWPPGQSCGARFHTIW